MSSALARVHCLSLAVILSFITSSAIIAQPISGVVPGGGTVTVTLAEDSPILRSEAPGPWWFDVAVSGATTVRGRLVLRFSDGRRKLPVFRSRELAVVAGVQRVLLTVPPVTVSPGLALAVDLEWELPDGDTVALGTLYQPAVVEANTRWTIGLYRTQPQALTFLPTARAWKLYRRGFGGGDRTTIHELEEVPRDPLGFLGFDLVLVAGDTFRDLDEAQLNALLQWIEAGGAVGLVPRGEFASRHLEFFRELSERAELRWPLKVTKENRLDYHPERSDLLIEFDCGFGRVVIANLEKAPEDYKDWTMAGARLWRLPIDSLGRVRPFERLELFRDSRPVPRMSTMIERLKPKQFQMIPTSLLVLLGVGYLLLIGPVDRKLFARLRRRRLTWAWLPVITIIYAAGIVALTEWYFGESSSVGRYIVVDVGAKGRVLRASCFELTVLNRERNVERTFVGETIDVVDPQRFHSDNHDPPNPVSSIEYTGRFPYDYQTREVIPMWSAVVHHRFWLPGHEQPEWLRRAVADGVDLDYVAPELMGLADLSVPEGSIEFAAAREKSSRAVGLAYGFSQPFSTLDRRAYEGVLFRVGDWGAGWTGEPRVIPTMTASLRVAAPSGAGNFDSIPVRARSGVRVEVHRKLGGDRVIIRRVFRRVAR